MRRKIVYRNAQSRAPQLIHTLVICRLYIVHNAVKRYHPKTHPNTVCLAVKLLTNPHKKAPGAGP